MIITKLFLGILGIVGGACALLVGGALIAGQVVPPADEIAYVSYSRANLDIFVIDVDHDITYNLTHNTAYDISPAWSPDGEWIAFVSDRDGGKRDIYLMDRFGGSVRRLTDQGVYAAPRWSADGSRVIFNSMNEAPNGIFSVGFDGSNFQRLNNPGSPRTSVTIDVGAEPGNPSQARSPDGSRIAFMTYHDQMWGIYISPDETRQDARLLVDVGRYTEAPVWSPNGKRMAYIALRDGAAELFMIDVDGDHAPRRLTFDHALDLTPAWRP